MCHRLGAERLSINIVRCIQSIRQHSWMAHKPNFTLVCSMSWVVLFIQCCRSINGDSFVVKISLTCHTHTRSGKNSQQRSSYHIDIMLYIDKRRIRMLCRIRMIHALLMGFRVTCFVFVSVLCSTKQHVVGDGIWTYARIRIPPGGLGGRSITGRCDRSPHSRLNTIVSCHLLNRTTMRRDFAWAWMKSRQRCSHCIYSCIRRGCCVDLMLAEMAFLGREYGTIRLVAQYAQYLVAAKYHIPSR